LITCYDQKLEALLQAVKTWMQRTTAFDTH